MREIESRGWELHKVEFKDGEYQASASNPSGKTVTRKGRNQSTALGGLLMAIMRREHVRSSSQKIGMWQTTWVDDMQQIAEAYAKAPIYDAKAAAAWRELADDSVRRMQVLAQQIDIEIVDDPEPYSNVQEMCEDVHQKRKFKVSRANSEHPIWSVDENIAFRVVHDVMGHCVAGGDFGWAGENAACAAHFPLLSDLAQQALFTECIAQSAYAQYYRSYGPQKIVLLPDFFGPAQYAENSVDHRGVPVDESYAPISMPEVVQSEEMGLTMEPGTQAPHESEEMGWPQGWYDYQQGNPRLPVISKTVNDDGEELWDPNRDWESDTEPAPQNAYLHYGNPLDWGLEGGVQDMAHRLQTNWYKQDESIGKMAVANALRAAILSPMKNLRWNSIQYQHLSSIPYSVTDPSVYQEALNQQRVNWNVSKFGPEYADIHKPYADEQRRLIALQKLNHPELSASEVKENVEREVENLLLNFERQLEAKEVHKSPDKQKSADQIAAAAAAKVNTFLKNMLKPKNERYDVEGFEQQKIFSAYEDVIPEQPELPEEDVAPTTKKPKVRKHNPGQENLLGEKLPAEAGDDELYGGWLIQQTKNIAAVSRHIDSIYEAAIEDVTNGGTGHIFRAEVLHLDLPGVGPKVASFAWLLLMPKNSQLATIDTHMIQMLGGKQSDLSNRDYFMYERMLRSRVDHMGYGSMPLGQAQWALWDAKRTGVGSHQDHSALRPLNYTPYEQVDWAKKDPTETRDWSKSIDFEKDENGEIILDRGRPRQIEGPEEWWANSEEAGELTRQLWDANEAAMHRHNDIPFRTANIFPTFAQAWQKLKPIRGTQKEVKQLAAYAVLNKTPRKEINEYMTKHKDEFYGGALDWKMFKEKLRKEIDKLQAPPGWKGSSYAGQRPFYMSETGDIVEGKDGDSIMKHLRRDLKLSPQEIWQMDLEVGRN
jgi:hypothetical protein